MCRFVAYIGKKSVLLDELINKPNHSLIDQSRTVTELGEGINADGFGLAWYEHAIDDIPGVFKSIRPAWNDNNLKSIAAKVKSKCFIAHVRASTVGNVTLGNCHPFIYKNFSFVHNGTLSQFNNIRLDLINALDKDLFNEIHAQTDSEHVFFLIMHYLRHSKTKSLQEAVTHAFQKIVDLQKDYDNDCYAILNIAITDGYQLIATRFVSKGHMSAVLNYAVGEGIEADKDQRLLVPGELTKTVVIASEPLSSDKHEWHEVPVNHMVTVKKDYAIKITSIDIE